MQKDNIHISVSENTKQPVEVIIREGDAPRHVYPQKYKVKGVIASPRSFSNMVRNKELCIVEYSYMNKTIKLLEDPTNPDAAEITGEIFINPDLVAFGINKNNYFTSAELINHAMKFAHCFKTTEEAKELINNLRNFEVTFDKTHKKEDDRNGKTEDSVKSAIKFHKGEIKTKLNLSIPFFIGSPKVDFSVEIEIEARNSAPAFAFYSIEMETLFRDQIELLIDNEIKVLSNSFTCIQLS